jgi:hypothetical protein
MSNLSVASEIDLSLSNNGKILPISSQTNNPLNSIKLWQARRESGRESNQLGTTISLPPELQNILPTRRALVASFLLGFGVLLTFQFILNLISYFEFLLSWEEVGYYVGITTTYPSLIVQFAMLSVGKVIPALYRIQGSYLLNAILLLFLIIAPANRGIIMTILAVSGIGTATLEASLFGYLSTLGKSGVFSAAASSGCAMAGVAACLIQILSRGFLPPKQAATVYCSIGCLILLSCMYAFYYLDHLEEVIETKTKSSQNQIEEKNMSSGAYINSGMVQREKQILGDSETTDSFKEFRNLRFSVIISDLQRASRLVFCPCLSIFLQFIATFLAFPGLTATIQYRGQDTIVKQDFFSFLNLTFSVSDVLGRLVAATHSPLSDYHLLLYSISRFMWVPLIYGLTRDWQGLTSDFSTILIMIGFGFTNGHVVALCTMASSTVQKNDRELAGFVTIACLHVGIVVGNNLALFFESAT